ncbi:RNA-directed DNA polymerase, eukaryota, reverse transcriptase zinc-binding domain protein [Tanacetum coccineum]
MNILRSHDTRPAGLVPGSKSAAMGSNGAQSKGINSSPQKQNHGRNPRAQKGHGQKSLNGGTNCVLGVNQPEFVLTKEGLQPTNKVEVDVKVTPGVERMNVDPETGKRNNGSQVNSVFEDITNMDGGRNLNMKNTKPHDNDMKEAEDKSEDGGRPDVCGRMGQDHCLYGGETAMSEPGGKLKRNRVEAEAGTGVEERTEANPKEFGYIPPVVNSFGDDTDTDLAVEDVRLVIEKEKETLNLSKQGVVDENGFQEVTRKSKLVQHHNTRNSDTNYNSKSDVKEAQRKSGKKYGRPTIKQVYQEKTTPKRFSVLTSMDPGLNENLEEGIVEDIGDNDYEVSSEKADTATFMADTMAGRPWVLLGDFNVALNIEDNSSGTSSITCGMGDFKDCMEEIEVRDLNQTGLHYTWNQRPNGEMGTLKKLDRIMGNTAFMASFPRSFASFQPYRISDHSPSVLKFPMMNREKPNPFKFPNLVTYKTDFLPLVEKIWNIDLEGHNMFKLITKLRALKGPIRKLLKLQGNLFDKVVKLREELEEIQTALDKDPTNTELRVEESHYLKAFNDAVLDEERFLKQKSKIKWLREGDGNTSYFHKVVKGRNHYNRIEAIRDTSGNYFEGEDVATHFVNHFH